MRNVPPSSSGVGYQRTRYNGLSATAVGAISWLLQTPDCWGQRACAGAVPVRPIAGMWSSDYIQGYPRTPVTNPVHDVSESSLLIEDRRGARIFKRDCADPLWRYSARRGPIPGSACARRAVR